jgi:hypothetical protein
LPTNRLFKSLIGEILSGIFYFNSLLDSL